MPAKDDVFANIESVADDGYMNIQPASGGEAVITYIAIPSGSNFIITFYDGSNSIVLEDKELSASVDPLPFRGEGFPVTNSKYIRVQNKDGGALLMGYTGYYTKATS